VISLGHRQGISWTAFGVYRTGRDATKQRTPRRSRSPLPVGSSSWQRHTAAAMAVAAAAIAAALDSIQARIVPGAENCGSEKLFNDTE